MKIFISWSGERSNKIANILREWIPCVIQSIKPYVSSKDIDKGARWSTDIAKELEDSYFGIICVTKSNINAPWINFEAGALSKAIDKSNVAPFLFDINPSEISGPISQFQFTIFDKEDIKSLMTTINGLCSEGRLSDAHFERSFEKWYPALEKELSTLNIDELVPEDDECEPVEMVHGLDTSDQAFKISKVKQELKTKLRFIDEFLESSSGILLSEEYKCMMLLDFFKQYIPVIYYMGKDLIDILNSDRSDKLKSSMFDDLVETADAMIQKYVSVNYNDDKSIFSLYDLGLNMLIEQLRELQNEYDAYIDQKNYKKEAEVI